MLQRTRERIPGLDAMGLSSSFLTYGFNRMWCQALNDKRYTHFAMLHADIVPHNDNWLNKLVRYADARNATMLSAVMPIKIPTGETSTAIAPAFKEFGEHYRITTREALTLPETFDAADVARLLGKAGDYHLLTNTGMMIIRLDGKRELLERMVFKVNNWIRRNEAGQYEAISEPEDWCFSRELQERGERVLATCAIGADHIAADGRRYSNQQAVG